MILNVRDVASTYLRNLCKDTIKVVACQVKALFFEKFKFRKYPDKKCNGNCDCLMSQTGSFSFLSLFLH